jgi:membrane protein YqaA with SNARE-associated domain
MIASQRRINLIRLATLIFVIAIIAAIFIFRSQISQLGAYGYPGIFLISIIANATILLPVPGVVFTSAMGAVFNPFWVAMAAGSGAALGELSGYLAGFSGQAVVENARYYERLKGWMAKYGGWAILVLAFIPNPAFDLAGITAGTLRMPLAKFLLFTWIGKLLKMLVFAYTGASIFGLFS